MRRIVGFVIIGLGVFLLVLAPVSRFFVYPRVAVAPLGCTGSSETCKDNISISASTGTATTLFDPATLTERSNVTINSVLRVRPDVTASVNGHTVYDGFTNTADGSGTTVNAFTERIAFDPHTSIMQDCCGANENGAPITDFSGLNPYKFGFGTEQKTYGFFDGTLNKSLPMVFTDVENIDGLEVYKFEQKIDPTQFGTLDVPGSLVGSTDPDVKAPEFYSNTRTVWVEPVTGAVVKGQEQQKQTLRASDGTDKVTLIDATIGFTPANIADSVRIAKDGKSQLNLVLVTIPLVGLVLGLILLALGLWLVFGASRNGASSARHQATGAVSAA
jgi:hypothetical protein